MRMEGEEGEQPLRASRDGHGPAVAGEREAVEQPEVGLHEFFIFLCRNLNVSIRTCQGPAAGNVTQTSVPPPSRLRAWAAPPCASAIMRTIERPRPVPPLWPRATSARVKRSNARSMKSAGIPGP